MDLLPTMQKLCTQVSELENAIHSLGSSITSLKPPETSIPSEPPSNTDVVPLPEHEDVAHETEAPVLDTSIASIEEFFPYNLEETETIPSLNYNAPTIQL